MTLTGVLAFGLVIALGVLTLMLRAVRAELRAAVGDRDAARAMNEPLQRGIAVAQERARAIDAEARAAISKLNKLHAEEVDSLLGDLARCQMPDVVRARLEKAGFLVKRAPVGPT